MAADSSESDPRDELIDALQKSLAAAKGVIESNDKNAALRERKIQLESAALRLTMATKLEDLAREHTDDLRRVKDDIAQISNLITQGEQAGKLDREHLGIIKGIMTNLGVTVRGIPTPTVTTFLVNNYIPERCLEADTQRHVENYVRLFAMATGDRQISSYVRADIVKWVRILEKLKPSYGRGKSLKNQTIQQVIQTSKGEVGLNRTTIEKHITHLKAFFKFSLKHYKFATSDDIDSLFGDIRLSDCVPDPRPRKLWKINHLNELFATPLWAGTRSRFEDVTKRHEPGPQIHIDAYWWLPIIALWTGARLEEMAQLHAEDLQFDMNQLPYIRIHDQGPRRLKNKNSIRNVPVHPFLEELGFLSLFEKNKGTRIFPELRKHGRPPKVGGLYSGHFTDYRKAVNLYEELRDFHSFRRTFITTMRLKAKVDILIVAQIAGHDSQEPNFVRLQQTDDYTEYNVEDLREAICKLDYESLGLNVSLLRRAASACGPAGTTRVEALPPPQMSSGIARGGAESRLNEITSCQPPSEKLLSKG
jgi:integrase